MNLSANDTVLLLLNIAVMLFAARGTGEILRRFKQPLVIGEIIAGIILGPTILGSIFPAAYKNLFLSSQNTQFALDGITSLAVVMLMLVSGLEVDLNIVLRQKRTAFSTSVLGIIFPFAVGFVAAYFFPALLGHKAVDDLTVFALFIGTALSITALPVVARTLMDLKLLKTELGFLIIASAMFNDLIGWLIFSIILGMIGVTSHSLGFGYILLITIAFLVIILFVGRKPIDKLIHKVQTYTSFPGGVLNLVLILGFLAAAFTEYLGIHAIFGAFIIGIAIGDSASLKENTRELIHQFITNIFAPLFFVAIGLKVNFVANFDPVIVFVFILLAFAGKIIGCSLGAYIGGLGRNESLAVGFGMNSRGAMEIVLGILALKAGLIDEKIFVAIVIMALFTSITSAPVMNYFIKKRKRETSLAFLLKQELIFITEAAEKKEILNQLAEKIAFHSNSNSAEILEGLIKREEVMATGIGHGIAIPHTRIKGISPVASLAIVKQGINFNSPDGTPAYAVFCLATPENKPEIQLQLLSEIAGKFRNNELIDYILKAENIKDIYNKIITH